MSSAAWAAGKTGLIGQLGQRLGCCCSGHHACEEATEAVQRPEEASKRNSTVINVFADEETDFIAGTMQPLANGDPQRAARVVQASCASSLWRYLPTNTRPIDIRVFPRIGGPRVGDFIEPGEIFWVSEERQGIDGTIYLKLADERGWLFSSKPGQGTMCAPFRGFEELSELGAALSAVLALSDHRAKGVRKTLPTTSGSPATLEETLLAVAAAARSQCFLPRLLLEHMSELAPCGGDLIANSGQEFWVRLPWQIKGPDIDQALSSTHGDTLKVFTVQSESMAAEWNQANPASRIEVGDCILRVGNSESALQTAVDMLRTWNNGDLLVLRPLWHRSAK